MDDLLTVRRIPITGILQLCKVIQGGPKVAKGFVMSITFS